jgi:Ca2+-transporting ATPase
MKSNTFEGLSQEEAEKILRIDGFNELPSQKKQGFLSIFLKTLSEPMLVLLVACGIIYLFVGDFKDALLLLFSVFVIITITLYQEIKTEKTIQALKNLSSPRALVIRDNEQKRVAG